MKYYFFGILFIFYTSASDAQTIDTALLRVKYKFTHIYDTTKPEKPLEEIMQLYVGKNETEYNSYEFEVEYARYHAAKWHFVAPDSSDHYGSNYPENYVRKSRMIQWGFPKENKNYAGYNLVYQLYFVYEFEMPKINWSIGEETRMIQNIKCQKATARVKGRQYEAWFAPELPFAAGPWKLTGLPGLLLEAKDLQQQVKFEFISVENVSTEKRLLLLPPQAIKTTRARFIALMEAASENPFIMGKFNGVSDETAENFLKDNEELLTKVKLTNSRKISPVMNNPIELIDK